MGEKDSTEKTLEAYNDVFSDIVNVLLFNGEQRISPDSLIDVTPRSQYKLDGKIHELERDVAKHWLAGNVNLAIYGLENQTKIDNNMPLRVIGYDGASYRGQVKKEDKADKKYCPVVTLVLYFGEKHWQKNTTLKERLKLPAELDSYVNDYRINVFEIAYLTPEQVKLFKSDFKIVADYFVQKRINKDYEPPNDVIKHVDEVLKLMSVLTNDTRYEDHINELKEGRTVTMCEVLDKAEARGEVRGEAKGIAKGIAIGENKGRITSIIDFVLDGTISLETGAAKAKMTVEAFKSLMEEYKATGKVVLN